MRLLLLFIFVPIIELMLLIKIGGMIGALPTIVLVIVTAVVGSQLVRRQGLTVLQRIQQAQARGEVPALDMLDGAALLFAGFMLLTPGFLTDICGFVLLIPVLRQKLARALVSRVVIMQPGAGPSRGAGRGPRDRGDDSTIEGDYRRTDRRNAHRRDDAGGGRIGRDDDA